MGNKCELVYFVYQSGKSPVQDFLDSLPKLQQSKLIRVLTIIQEYGLSSAIPHTKKLSGTPFWEIRVLGKDNLRAIYVTVNSQSIVILHGFTKKSQKTPTKEIETAFSRYRLLLTYPI